MYANADKECWEKVLINALHIKEGCFVISQRQTSPRNKTRRFKQNIQTAHATLKRYGKMSRVCGKPASYVGNV